MKESRLKVCCWVAILMLSGSFGLEASPNYHFRVLDKPLVLEVRATAYTHTESDHLAYGKLSAYGNVLRSGERYNSAAADWSFLPIGTVFRIRGHGPTYFVVDDYGSALTGKGVVDLYFETTEEMNRWGARKVEIEILRVGDYRASYRILLDRIRYRHCYQMAKRIYDRYQKLSQADSG